jgi:hypothetical protein
MEAMEDELERLRSENARLMEANRVLAAENEALKHNPVDALWPIRQHLLAQLHHHHQQQQQQRHPEENALEKAVPPKDKEEMSKETSALSPRSSMSVLLSFGLVC